MPRTPNEIFIVYELGHVDEAQKRDEQGMTVVCLDFLAEQECKKKNIPLVSLRDLVDSTAEEEKWWVLSHQIAREWYRLPSMKFFEYDGIRIAEAPEPIMQEYLSRLFYYTHVFIALKKRYPDASLSIPVPVVNTAPDASCLAPFMAWAIVDATRMAGLRSDIDGMRPRQATYVFPRATKKSLLIQAYNTFVSLIPRSGFRIYASGYWTHLAPVVPYLNDTELILIESKKFYEIPWRQIIKHRIRIRGLSNAISVSEKRTALQIGENFVEKWKVSRGDVAAYLANISEDLDWSPVLEACEYLINYAPRVIADIRTLERTMKKEKPDVVVQMGSVGGPQHYFFLMARVAEQLAIPSVELEHAAAVVDTRSWGSRIETDFLATYGTDVNSLYEHLGCSPRRLIAVGSPRFDQYVNEHAYGVEKGNQLFKQLGLDPSRQVLLVFVPFSDTFAPALDSYQLAEFFRTIRDLQNKNPGLQVLIKFRQEKHIGLMREYLKELFHVDVVITGSEDIFPLLCASDAVVCNHSTTIYQAILARKPLVLYGWKDFDTRNAEIYQHDIPLVRTEEAFVEVLSRIFAEASYRDELMKKQEEFLKKYSFDGKSSERVAKLLHDIPELYKKSHQSRS